MSDAAQAFEQLRAEVTVMRRTVEELHAAIEAVPTVDYAPTLGQIVEVQAQIADDVDAIAEATGGLSFAERVRQGLFEVTNAAMRPAIDRLAMAQNDALEAAREMRRALDFVLTEQEQRRALKWAFGVGVAVGLLLFALFVRPIVDRLAGPAEPAPQQLAIPRAEGAPGSPSVEQPRTASRPPS